MMTPFGSDFARELVVEELPMSDGIYTPLQYLYEIYFRIVADELSDSERKSLEKTFRAENQYSEEEIQELVDDKSVDYETAYQCWAAACLLDAAFSGTDYSGDCIGYADKYNDAVRSIADASKKRKFLTRKPVHDILKIVNTATDSLDYVLGIPADSELADEMRENGRYEQFLESINALQGRLVNLAEKYE